MNEDVARHVVDALRERGIDAHRADEGVYEFGVRVVLSGGREALWGTDGTATLSAEVMCDGDLTGFIPQIPGSDGFTTPEIVDAISRADYQRPEGQELPSAPPPAPALPAAGGVFRRFIDGFRYRD
jgi:hypothetical protein